MMILRKPRLTICAGVFGLAATFGGSASAAQVYPGCAVPPTTFNHIWYIDPVNGKTPAEGGLGTQAAPWNSLQAAFSVQPGYKGPLLTTAPYRHSRAGAGYVTEPGPDSGPVNPGDEILLMSGAYGDVSTSDWTIGLKNPAFVTIAAAPGQTPVFSFLAAVASSYFVFSGIKVEGTADSSPAHARFPLVLVGPHGALTSSNVVLANMRVTSADDTSSWTTQADWRAKRRIGGIFTQAGATCVSVTDSHISNIEFGLAVSADNMLASGNDIERFGDDGIDYAASNILITKNYIHDNLDLADGAHPDGIQGYPGKYSNVVIDSNRVIRQTDPNLPFPNFLQGIDAFDGDWENLTATNNVVVTSSCWGMVFGSAHHGRVINNTVLFDEWSRPTAGNCRPGLSVGDKTHNGASSNDVVIRNNLTNGVGIYNLDLDMVMDHNICLAIDGACRILTWNANGKPDWGTFKPGVYGDHNLIDRRGAESQFVNFDPAKFVFDVRLKAGASAIGAGNPAEAPATDITGAARGNSVDVGAYRFSPGQ